MTLLWLLPLTVARHTVATALGVEELPASGKSSQPAAAPTATAWPCPTATPTSAADGPANRFPLVPDNTTLLDTAMRGSDSRGETPRGLIGLTAYYYDHVHLNPPVVGTESYGEPLNFHLDCSGEASPWPGCKLYAGLSTGDYYSVHWDGVLRAPVTGTYSFELANCDDGAQLYLDDNLLADAGWNWPAPNTQGPTATLTLTAGFHPFSVNFEQRPPYIASLEVWWSGPGFGPEIIPLLGLPDDQTWAPCECPFGCSTASQNWEGGPINTRTGNYYYTKSDFSLPVLGPRLHFEHSYNVQANGLYTAPLGFGWTHNYAMDIVSPGDPGG
ncbi:MAG: DUF6531 domain-containing protein, partial [Anaerolineae bacterium]|nr:DUF6531 domain-containing protein [Anaerolineae bacterium]